MKIRLCSLLTDRDLCPDTVLNKTIKKVPGHIWITFITAVTAGLLIHMFMFTNKLPNFDDFRHTFELDFGTTSGRWLVPYISQIDGNFSMPWVIGVLSVLMLGLSASLVVSILKIKRGLYCVLTALVMVSFPTVTNTFAYMFTAGIYFISLFLACIAVYITANKRYGFIAGIFALALSLGIYQSYFCVAAALFVLLLFLDVIDGMVLKQVFFRAFKFLITLFSGIGLYYIIVRLTTLHTGLLGYRGIDNMGNLELKKLPGLIIAAYKKFYTFFYSDDSGVHLPSGKVVFFLLLWGIIIITCLLVFRNLRKKPLNIAALIVFLALVPLAANSIYIMAPESTPYLLMLYAMSVFLIAPVALAERTCFILKQRSTEVKAPRSITLLTSASCWLIVLSLLFTAYSYTLTANKVYFKLDLAFKGAYSFSTRLISDIQDVPGYVNDMEIVFIGDPSAVISNPSYLLQEITLPGVHSMPGYLSVYSYRDFINYYIGFRCKIHQYNSKLAGELGQLDEVKSLAVYPEKESIRIINNYIVVNFKRAK